MSVLKGVSIHVMSYKNSVLAGTALFLALSGSSWAGWLENHEQQIRIDGTVFEGRWAYIGDRPYVNVESFGKALGLPRRHNVKNWYLSSQGAPKGSPFQMQVESVTGKLPTVRNGGATFVDLEAACKAMQIPFHYDFYDMVYEVGDAYKGQYMIGAWQRWLNGKETLYGGTHIKGALDQGHFNIHIDPNKTDGI